MKIRVVIQDVYRIGEETMLLLPAYLEACILCGMRVSQTEAVLSVSTVSTVLPGHIHITCLNGAQQLVSEVRNMRSLLLQVLHALLDILAAGVGLAPAHEILVTAALEPQLERLLLHQVLDRCSTGSNGLGAGTLLNHVQILSSFTALTIADQTLRIKTSNLNL